MRRQTQTIHPFCSFIYSFPTQQDCVLPVIKSAERIHSSRLKLVFDSAHVNATFKWLNRVIHDHEARASDLNRKLIFSFFLLFS